MIIITIITTWAGAMVEAAVAVAVAEEISNQLE